MLYRTNNWSSLQGFDERVPGHPARPYDAGVRVTPYPVAPSCGAVLAYDGSAFINKKTGEGWSPKGGCGVVSEGGCVDALLVGSFRLTQNTQNPWRYCVSPSATGHPARPYGAGIRVTPFLWRRFSL